MKATEIEKHEIVPTNIPLLNEILGGGFPSRIFTEVAGPPGCGKTTLALQFLAHAQKLGRPCYYADAERAIDFVEFASKLGVDCDTLEYDKQDYAEALLDNIVDWIDGRKGTGKELEIEPHENAVVIVDAIGALHGREESEKRMEGRSIGIQSRLIATFCRTLAPIIDRRNTIFIMVNHIFTELSSGAIRSSGGAKLTYHKGLALWLKDAYGKSPRRSTDGTKTLRYVEAEIRSKAKYSGAFDGRKVILEFVPKEGFTTQPSPPAKRGRPKKDETSL